MNTETHTTGIPPEDMAELQAAVDRLARGVRDDALMDRACAEMDQGREEIRRRLGELNVAGDLIREARDDA